MTTRDEIMTMDEDALRLAVAQTRKPVVDDGGYSKIFPGDKSWDCFDLPESKNDAIAILDELEEKYHIRTHYSTDIRAAYALEDALPEERREAYWRRLRWVLQNKDLTDFSGWSLLHASAADRCRAWLLTMEA